MEILQLQSSLRPAPGRTARTNVGGLRTILSLALAIAFMLCSFVPAAAQTTTGTINGTITGQNGTPLSGVAVTAVSPSQRYAATTNANGFFSLTGVVPDTYQITLARTGYQNATVDGVTVTPGQAVSVTQTLSQQLANIGRTSSRSGGSAFQPQQTQDTYTVTTDQINTVLGKSNGTNEANLLASIPGASFDSTGYPVLRGGRENQEGYQFEGINYTDPFTNQFVNSLILHGASQFQVTPGAGDASTGNAGTGAINVIAKRGTNPHFGQFEYDLYGGRSEQTGNVEYGWASPNGRLSSYTTFLEDRVGGYQYGAKGVPAGYLGQGTIFNGRRNQFAEDFLENAVYQVRPRQQPVAAVLLRQHVLRGASRLRLSEPAQRLRPGRHPVVFQKQRPVLPHVRIGPDRLEQSADPGARAVHDRPDVPHAAARDPRAVHVQPAQRVLQAAVLLERQPVDVLDGEALHREQRRAVRRSRTRWAHSTAATTCRSRAASRAAWRST